MLPANWGRSEFASLGTVFTPTQRNDTAGKPALLFPSWMAFKLVSNRCLLEHVLWSLINRARLCLTAGIAGVFDCPLLMELLPQCNCLRLVFHADVFQFKLTDRSQTTHV